jgi:undecaprenol kinase/diacylglycerol kinase (ATP)
MSTFLKGFVYARNGIIFLVKSERNFRVHLVVLILVIALGWYFSITRNEWLVITLTASVVLALEGVNTSIERLSDLYSTDQNEQIRVIKDVAAGAVLIAAIGAVIVGILVFVPYMLN